MCHLCKFRDESAVASHEPQELQTSMTLVGVGQSLTASILPSSVATPLAEMTCPRQANCLWNSLHFEGLIPTLPPPVSGRQPQVS